MPLDNLKQVTGYIRGGCSPVGMKHLFPTTIDQSASSREKIIVSGGQRGIQIVLQLKDLVSMTNAQVEDITQNSNIVTDITNRMTNCVISVNFKPK